MIWPTLCNALMFSSVWLKSFSRPLISRRKFLSLTSQFLDSSSESVYREIASCLSGSAMVAVRGLCGERPGCKDSAGGGVGNWAL